MAASNAVWGIDLGQCALKALRLRAAGDKVEAIDHVYIEYPKILSQPDADRQALITEAMKKFADGHDLTRETLVVAVPGQHTLARFTKLPPVPKKKIPEIVKYEAQQQIPFDMEEVIWDYQTFEDPQAMETQVGIFAMRRELLRNHLQFLSNLNLEPGSVQSAPLALYNALKFDGITGAEPVTILDIGAQNTDLIVVDGDSLWTRNIPLGGNNFTEALLKTFKLSFSKAENLKRTAASSKYARQIFQAMRPVFADLVAEVQRSIGFFTSSRRGVKLNKLIAMGNAFKLPGMVKFVQQNLGMEVVRPTTFNRLVTSEAANAPQLTDQLLSFGVAYGLALQGLGKAQITSNLVPPEITKQVVWRKKTPWFYGAAACLAVSAALVWVKNFADQKEVDRAREGSNAVQPFQVVYDPQKDPHQENPQPDPRARDVLQGAPSNLAPVAYAKLVSYTAQHFTELQNKVENLNADEITKATALSKLQSNKAVWPQILHMIHSALPVPQKELTDAVDQGPDAWKQAAQKIERGKRNIVFIQTFNAQYSSDVVSLFNEASKGGPEGGQPIGLPGAPQAGGAQPQPGFLLTITGTTPNGRGFDFVNETFLNSLRKASEPGMYVHGLKVQWQAKVKDAGPGGTPAPTAAPMGRMPMGPMGGPEGPAFRGRMGGGFMPGMGAGMVARDENKDAITGELIGNDTRFSVIVAVVLQDKPAAAPNGAAPAAAQPPAAE